MLLVFWLASLLPTAAALVILFRRKRQKNVFVPRSVQIGLGSAALASAFTAIFLNCAIIAEADAQGGIQLMMVPLYASASAFVAFGLGWAATEVALTFCYWRSKNVLLQSESENHPIGVIYTPGAPWSILPCQCNAATLPGPRNWPFFASGSRRAK